MPGPKREPTSLKRLKGNPSKRKLPKNEAAPAGVAVKPSCLTLEGLRAWDEIVPPLITAGLATSADTAALVLLSETYADYLRLHRLTYGHELLTRGGKYIDDPETGEQICVRKPDLVKNPALAPLSQARDALLRQMDHFGMTPSARAKLALPDQTGGGRDEFETFLRIAR